MAAAALALVLGLPALDAHALALGRVTVLSALGEPLRAEIDVPDINVDEAASLKASVANPDAFKAAGLEYNPALGALQITLLRRPDGRAYLRLAGDRPINEPFVDLILEANWAAGKIVRDYTMLFDPANLRAASAPSSGVTAATVPSAGSTAPSSLAAAPSAPSVTAPRTTPQRTVTPKATRAVARSTEKPVTASGDGTKVTVKPGNTATQIAAQYKPVGVSLDQMLVAMLQANPDAFSRNNINRLKSGAVLDLPSAAQASAVSEGEARQVITAQSKDFNEFRRRLAIGAPTSTAPSASRAASGTVQAKVEDRKPAAVAPDKLTLSKGSVAATASASATKSNKEEVIAKEKQAKDAAMRTAEIAKNIQDLSKLNTTTATVKPDVASAAASASKTGITVATGASAIASSAPSSPLASTKSVTTTPAASAPLASASVSKTTASQPLAASSASPALATVTSTVSNTATVTPATASTTETVAAQATTSVAKPPAPVAKPATPPAPESSLIGDLLDSPFTLPGTGVVLALLAGFGFYRLRKSKSSTQVDSSFLESRLQPDSFFGASGGQRIDTSDAAASGTGSSMVYSPSQLDAAGDVDPVAEADVYLAYGRDLQAEEILKEAMRTNPSRVAIHTKLMEIYAKRRDTKAFEIVAHEAYAISKGQGAEWDAASTMGRELDPANPLYQPGGMPSQATAGSAAVAFAAHTQPPSESPSLPPANNSDFDLDFSLEDELAAASKPAQNHTATSPIHVEPTVSMQAPTPSAMSPLVDLNFDIPPVPKTATSTGNNAMKLSVPDMAPFASGLSFTPEPFVAATAPTAPAKVASAEAPAVMEAMEFDMGSLSLDLPGTSSAKSVVTDTVDSDDPLATKLALAQEFHEIGDTDGARALAQEVAMEATGALKIRAQRMVTDLS